MSSFIPRENAAEKPIIDQAKGIIIIIKGHLPRRNKSNPKLKIVVGHGNPNVDDAG